MCACSTDDDDLDEELSENDAPKVKKKKKAKKSSRESKGSKRNRSRREVMAFFVSVCGYCLCAISLENAVFTFLMLWIRNLPHSVLMRNRAI